MNGNEGNEKMTKNRKGFGGMWYLRLAGIKNDSHCDGVFCETKGISPQRIKYNILFVLTAVISVFGSDSFGASTGGLTVMLCDNGYADNSSSTAANRHCEPYAQGNCPSGYYELPENSGSFIATTGNGRCQSASFSKYTTSLDIFDFTYTGVILGDAITLCDNGYSRNNSDCTTYARANCDASHYKLVGTETSFVDVGANDTCDTTGFVNKLTLSDTLSYLVYNGILVGSELTLCSNGYLTDGSSSCTTYASGYCPTGYYDLDTDAGFITLQSSGACGSDYGSYNGTETCGYNPMLTTCLDLCENGQMTTELGTCASMCSLGATTLRTSNGLVLPLWSTVQDTPSINVGLTGGTCYVNLMTGSGSGINVQYDGNNYHAVR